MPITLVSLSLLAVLVMASCAFGRHVDPIPTFTLFDPVEAEYINQPGDNSIEGQAFLRQSGGGVVTCAGRDVRLIPQTPYARERIRNIYGTILGPARGRQEVDTADPRYWEMSRQTTCDAQGNFRFTNVPDGEYFVISRVQWMVSRVPQGSPVMIAVAVSSGETANVIISP